MFQEQPQHLQGLAKGRRALYLTLTWDIEHVFLRYRAPDTETNKWIFVAPDTIKAVE